MTKRSRSGTKPRPKQPRQPVESAFGGRNYPGAIAATAVIFFFHSLGLLFIYSPVNGLFNDLPIIEQDWGLHFHHLKSMEAFWRQDGRLWGYSPDFMAGYPSNTIQDLSIKLFEIIALALSAIALTPLQWFKISAFLATASVPWLMYFASRNLFHDQAIKDIAATVAAFLGTIYWWNSLPREMFFYGMIGFPTAAYASLLGISLFYRVAKQPTSWGAVHWCWLLFAIIIPPLHIQSLAIIIPPALAFLAIRSRLLSVKPFVWITAAAVVAVAANMIWLVPAFSHRGDDVSGGIVEQLSLFISSDPFTFLKDYLGNKGYWTFRSSFWEKGFRLTLLVLGIMGTSRLFRDGHKQTGILLAAALISLFLLSYFGSLFPVLKAWQSMRFKVPYDLFLVIPASYLVARGRTASPSAAPSYMVPALLAGAMLSFLVNLVQTESQGKLNLRTEIRPEINAIARWVRENTPAGGRVLFEESGDETGFVYDGMYLSAFIPHWTGRELIGGPINLYNDRHHFAESHSGKLLKRDIQSFTDNELKNYFHLYNIGAVVAFHPESLQRLRSVPGLLTLDRRIGPVHLLTVNQPLSWFLQGEGKVKTGPNRLQVSEVDGNEIILKYHWVSGLVSSPSARIVPVKLYDDPIPFIKVVNPPASFTLKVAH